MKILEEKLSASELKKMAGELFGNLVKAVVDIRRRVMAVDAELHADEETLLMENGSRQEDLWGINLYPDIERNDPDFIEFDSMINLRPSQNNLSRSIDDPEIRKTIVGVVREWIA